MKSLREVSQNMRSGIPISMRNLWKMIIWIDTPSEVSLRKLIEHGSAPKYFFRLDEFRIERTRSLQEDTDHVNFALMIGGNMLDPLYKFMGDVNDGTHYVGLSYGPIPIENPNTVVKFNYQIMNHGHGSVDEAFKSTLDKSATVLGGMMTGVGLVCPPAATAAAIFGAAWKGVVEIFKVFLTDCDGPVAIDQIETTERDLRNATSETGEFRDTRYYPGIDSPTGCGSNSKYYVTWSVIRQW